MLSRAAANCMAAKADWTFPLNNESNDNTGDMNGRCMYRCWYDMEIAKEIKFTTINYVPLFQFCNMITYGCIVFIFTLGHARYALIGPRHKDCCRLPDTTILNRLWFSFYMNEITQHINHVDAYTNCVPAI